MTSNRSLAAVAGAIDVAQVTLVEVETARAVAEQTLDTTRDVCGDTSAGLQAARQALARAEELLRVAEQTRDGVREINRRTGGAGAPLS